MPMPMPMPMPKPMPMPWAHGHSQVAASSSSSHSQPFSAIWISFWEANVFANEPGETTLGSLLARCAKNAWEMVANFGCGHCLPFCLPFCFHFSSIFPALLSPRGLARILALFTAKLLANNSTWIGRDGEGQPGVITAWHFVAFCCPPGCGCTTSNVAAAAAVAWV
jgi:hypothetical protein